MTLATPVHGRRRRRLTLTATTHPRQPGEALPPPAGTGCTTCRWYRQQPEPIKAPDGYPSAAAAARCRLPRRAWADGGRVDFRARRLAHRPGATPCSSASRTRLKVKAAAVPAGLFANAVLRITRADGALAVVGRPLNDIVALRAAA